MRRALGFKLTRWAGQLSSFVDYCEAHHAERITTELALAWATETPRGSRDEVYWSRRLMVVRIFARHLQTLDPTTEVPPEDALPHHTRRVAPYLYSPAEITALIGAAGRLKPPLRAATWQTLIGLLAVTGMRKSEACRLDRNQVDLDNGVLVIADSKFGKSRRVFLHRSTIAALRRYEQRRDSLVPRTGSAQLLRVHPRHPAGRSQHHSHVRRPRQRRWDPSAAGTAPPADARPAACVHSCHVAGVLPRRR